MTITRQEFDILAAQTGLPLSEAQKDTLFSVYPVIQAISARVTAPLPREAEPSLTFKTESK